MTAHEQLLAAAAEMRRDEHGNWAGTWPSPSQDPWHAEDLAREVTLTWLLPETKARALPWVRERFADRRPARCHGLVAFSRDRKGRVVRAWTRRDDDAAAYDAILAAGRGTCPMEGIWPPSIQFGVPAVPAHPFLLPALWQARAAAEGTPVELPDASMDDVANAEELRRAFWQGLATDAPP